MHRWDPRCPPRDDVVHPVPVDPAGRAGPTRGQAAGPGWRRTSRGLFVPSSVSDELPEQRIAEQAARLPPGGAVTGWAACRLWGGSFFDGLAPDGRTRLPVPLDLGPVARLRPGAGALVVRTRLGPEQVTRGPARRTRRDRAVVDAMRLAPDLVEAVVAADMAMAAAISSPVRLARELLARPGLPGLRQVRAALRLASEHSRSPAETRLRLLAVGRAGLPAAVLVNCAVRDPAGRLLGVADLLDQEAGLVVEYDGAEHRGDRRSSRDAVKDEDLRDAGLEVTRVTGRDLHDPDLVVARLVRARARALVSRGPRRWVVTPPAPWVEAEITEREALERWHAGA
ncbi:hypothetical protein ENKNEFLB_00970 [Nocardioides aquaticus]|uniref:DUF559 domain-containing protein n=1 Tax=Nocardioides aquaticus TaxID=160826 RepID=A0ABX8EET9_9ACTN|nr:hypothetical protein ENKNEFLB_00970 [Nocardioides aquaticus]